MDAYRDLVTRIAVRLFNGRVITKQEHEGERKMGVKVQGETEKGSSSWETERWIPHLTGEALEKKKEKAREHNFEVVTDKKVYGRLVDTMAFDKPAFALKPRMEMVDGELEVVNPDGMLLIDHASLTRTLDKIESGKYIACELGDDTYTTKTGNTGFNYNVTEFKTDEDDKDPFAGD